MGTHSDKHPRAHVDSIFYANRDFNCRSDSCGFAGTHRHSHTYVDTNSYTTARRHSHAYVDANGYIAAAA